MHYRKFATEGCIVSRKKYENWLAIDKVTAKNSWLSFLAHPVGLSFS